MNIRLHNDPKEYPKMPNPACTCNRPMMIAVPAGKHFHPCPVHPESVIYGGALIC